MDHLLFDALVHGPITRELSVSTRMVSLTRSILGAVFQDRITEPADAVQNLLRYHRSSHTAVAQARERVSMLLSERIRAGGHSDCDAFGLLGSVSGSCLLPQPHPSARENSPSAPP